jgi:putative sigma-54 modulation protein
MQVMVTFRRVRSTKGLRQHAEEKVEHAVKFLRPPVEAHVILSVEKQRHIAEVQVTGSHLNLTATEETGDLYSAIDLAASKLERQIKKRLGKIKDRKANNHAPATLADDDRRKRTGAVIHTQRIAVKPMSVGEAVLQLQLVKNDFLLFKNAATEMLSVVYRRKDGNYGLIEPELS